jgi:predicted small metal-binding protein
MKELRCADAGFECDAVIQGEDEQEVMSKAGEHARQVHGMDQIDEQTGAQLRALIHEA